MKYILASGSPRRKELLTQMGITEFDVIISDVEETTKETLPQNVVSDLSRQKCNAVADALTITEPTIVIAADTVVAYQDQILGKPQNEEDAFQMLSHLSGHTHSVFTGVSLMLLTPEKETKKDSFYVETKVKMRAFTEEEIRTYIQTGEPMDKAGSYGIQGRGAILVEQITGDYNNVVGLPITRLYEALCSMFR